MRLEGERSPPSAGRSLAVANGGGVGTEEGRSASEPTTSPANPDGGGGPNADRGERPTPRDPIIPGLEHPLDTAEREAREAASNAQPARNNKAAEPSPAQKELGRIRDNLVERPRRVLQGYLAGRPPEETGAGLGLTPEQSRNAYQVMANHAADLLRRRGFGEDDIRTALTPRPRKPGATSQDIGELSPPRDPIIPGIEHPLDVADREQRRLEALRSKPSAPTPAEVIREQMVPNIAELPKAIILARLEGRTPEEISQQLGITPERADRGGYAIGRQIENTMIDRGIDPAAAREAMTPRPPRPVENQASGERPSPQTGVSKPAGESPILASSPAKEGDVGRYPVLEGRRDQPRSGGQYTPEKHLYGQATLHSETSFVPAERLSGIGSFMDKIWKASGLTNADKHAQWKAALAIPNPRHVENLVASDSGFPSHEALSTAKQAMQELLNMLPRKIADLIPAFHLRFDPGEFGEYKGIILSLGGEHWGKPSWLPHVWHELAHAIHLNAPDAYKATLARHFRVRTQGEKEVPVGLAGEVGKEDRWLPNRDDPKFIYAGRIYPGEPIGAGLELPSEYMSYMQNEDGAALALAKDRETVMKVLSIFFWGRSLK